MLILALLYLIAGLALMGASIPMIQRKVRPNGWYGFRTPKTFRSERIWYAANEYAGRVLFLAGLCTAHAAILLLPLGLVPHVGKDGYSIACLVVMLGSLAWAVIKSFQYLSRL